MTFPAKYSVKRRTLLIRSLSREKGARNGGDNCVRPDLLYHEGDGGDRGQQGYHDPSNVTAVVMLADAYSKVRNVYTSAAIYCREMVVFSKYLQCTPVSRCLLLSAGQTREKCSVIGGVSLLA